MVDHSDVVGASPVGAAPANYIFKLDLTPGFNGLGKDNCKTRRETFKFWDLVRLIQEVLRYLTHWGRATHVCISKLTIIGSDNGLSPDRRQAIIWTKAGSLLIGPLGTNFSEILIEILTFSLKKMRLKVSSAKWLPFCLGLIVLKQWDIIIHALASMVV